MDLSGIGKVLLVVAGVLALFGLIFFLVGRGVIPRLPGDIAVQRKNWSIYVPIGTSIVLSIVVTVLLNLFLRR